MQKILQTDDITDNQVLRKRKRKRTETANSENANSALEKAQRDPYSGNAFLPGESSSDEETPLMELSKEELCNKIESLKEKLRSIRKENSRLRQSLVILQVLPQAVTQFEQLVGMAETLLKMEEPCPHQRLLSGEQQTTPPQIRLPLCAVIPTLLPAPQVP